MMGLHLPVLPRTYGSAVNEAQAWKQRAEAAEERNVNLLASNGALTARVEGLERQLSTANDAAQGLRSALARGAEKATPAPVDADLQKELALAREQIARQDAALTAYERDHQGLLDDLRLLAEQRDTALATVERMGLDGKWTPEGVAS